MKRPTPSHTPPRPKRCSHPPHAASSWQQASRPSSLSPSCALPVSLPPLEQKADNDIEVLAIGFLLVILSSALWHNYLPLLVVATYVVAPLPNFICGRCANPDDFMESSGSAVVDFGRFCTGFLVVMGIGESAGPFFTLSRHRHEKNERRVF